MFNLTIQLGNDAMQTADHVARALEHVANEVASNVERGPIWDANGNRVGSFAFQPALEPDPAGDAEADQIARYLDGRETGPETVGLVPEHLAPCDYCDGAHVDPNDCPYRPEAA